MILFLVYLLFTITSVYTGYKIITDSELHIDTIEGLNKAMIGLLLLTMGVVPVVNTLCFGYVIYMKVKENG